MGPPSPLPPPPPPSPSASSKRISCIVEQELPDLLLVSFRSTTNDEIFHGALIRSSKASSFVPLGITGFHDRLQDDNPRDYIAESFPSLSKRHTYFQSRRPSSKGGVVGAGRHVPSTKSRSALGVRLRARQVLCNKCKNVCNEKGESVQERKRTTRKRVVSVTTTNHKDVQKGKKEAVGAEAQVYSDDIARKFTLVPKIKRLEPEEIRHYSSSGDGSSPENSPPLIKIKVSNGETRNLRKKRSAVGSMEDLWDETVFEESTATETNDDEEEEEENEDDGNNIKSLAAPKSSKSTPILKISFGSTVLKIPAKYRNSENNDRMVEKDASVTKAARRALKRARREAQKRMQNGGDGVSPHHRSPFMSPARSPITPGGRSPAYSVILPSSSPNGQSGQKMIIRKPRHHKRKKHKRKKGDGDDDGDDEDLAGQTVDSCVMEDGKNMCVGDIVWGKKDETPWWPGKVTNIYLRPGSDGKIQPEVKIAWYAYNGSSLLDCAQIKPFREFFQDCFSSQSSSDVTSFAEAVRAASEENQAKGSPPISMLPPSSSTLDCPS